MQQDEKNIGNILGEEIEKAGLSTKLGIWRIDKNYGAVGFSVQVNELGSSKIVRWVIPDGTDEAIRKSSAKNIRHWLDSR